MVWHITLMETVMSTRQDKNLAIANRSRVSCAHTMSRASMITP